MVDSSAKKDATTWSANCLGGDRGGSDSLTVNAVLLELLTTLSVFITFLAGAVDSDLDSNCTALNFLLVHLSDGLLLLFLGAESDETEATAFAGFVAGLKLLDHEAGDGAKGDLGGGGLVGSEELLELWDNPVSNLHVGFEAVDNLTFSSLRS